jgi:hypothetical protein
MESVALNHLAVLTATVLAFVLGAIWYGPLFGKLWMRETGITPEIQAKGSPAKTYGLAFLWTAVMAYNLAFFIGDPSISARTATLYGFATGAGWIAMAIFVIGLFERRSTLLMLINGGYMAVALTMMGAVIGAWR